MLSDEANLKGRGGCFAASLALCYQQYLYRQFVHHLHFSSNSAECTSNLLTRDYRQPTEQNRAPLSLFLSPCVVYCRRLIKWDCSQNHRCDMTYKQDGHPASRRSPKIQIYHHSLNNKEWVLIFRTHFWCLIQVFRENINISVILYARVVVMVVSQQVFKYVFKKLRKTNRDECERSEPLCVGQWVRGQETNTMGVAVSAH